MNSVPKLFSCSYADCWTEKHFSTEFGVLTPNHTHSHTLFWGCVSRWFGRALAWHARGQRFDPAILHQKSTVLRRKHSAFLFYSGKKIRGCTARHAGGPVTPPISTTADISPAGSTGVSAGVSVGSMGARPTAPAPAWQGLAGAPAVRQRGRRRRQSHAAFFKNSIFLIVFHSLSVKALKKSFPSFLNGSAIRLKASSTRS